VATGGIEASRSLTIAETGGGSLILRGIHRAKSSDLSSSERPGNLVGTSSVGKERDLVFGGEKGSKYSEIGSGQGYHPQQQEKSLHKKKESPGKNTNPEHLGLWGIRKNNIKDGARTKGGVNATYVEKIDPAP